jgi:hypothetical protein
VCATRQHPATPEVRERHNKPSSTTGTALFPISWICSVGRRARSSAVLRTLGMPTVLARLAHRRRCVISAIRSAAGAGGGKDQVRRELISSWHFAAQANTSNFTPGFGKCEHGPRPVPIGCDAHHLLQSLAGIKISRSAAVSRRPCVLSFGRHRRRGFGNAHLDSETNSGLPQTCRPLCGRLRVRLALIRNKGWDDDRSH